LGGGDDFFTASTTAPPSGSIPQYPPAVTAWGPDGTHYHFPALTQGSTGFVKSFIQTPDYVEDRNGNIIRGSTDTLGGSGIAVPFTTTPANVSYSNFAFNFIRLDNRPGGCGGISNGTGQVSVSSSVNLPNGRQYQFQYDPTYGLLSKITYPTGGYVSYTWGLNPLSESVTLPVSNGDVCVYAYDTPAITHRYISFDGVNVALQQDFSYSTTWGGVNWDFWTTKQTTVTTHDLVRGTTFQTIYTYSPVTAPGGPNTNGSGQAAAESSIIYKDVSGGTLLTVTKGWLSQSLLNCELKTLNNGLISGTYYSYGPGGQVTDTKEYEYGLITSTSGCYTGYPPATAPSGITPTRETAITYLTSIPDKPTTVKTYGVGVLLSETDYAYDQTAVASVSNLPAGTHDETTYGPSSTVPRGNLTTKTVKCLQVGSCVDSVTKYTYDETGQVLSMIDSCGNTTCGDMTGANHTTIYSYADSYTSCGGTAPPSGNTNAYRTRITNPLGHMQNLCYGYNDGQLRSVTDANSQTTTYKYNDSLLRSTETDFPDGGKTTISYNDAPYNSSTPSPSVTTTSATTSTTNAISLVAFDGIGHTVRSVLTSDPNCSSGDRTDTTYDGLARPYTVSNPYCSTSDATYGLTTYTYDTLGRTTQVAHPDSTTVLTSYTGRATQVQDEGNGTQRVQRISQTDALGRLVSVCEVGSTTLLGNGGAPAACGQDIAGTGFLTTYQYDALSNLTQVTQGSLSARTFSYNSLSQLASAYNPESGTVSYTYDANGNLSTKTSPAPNQSGTATVALSYCYDALNRLTTKAYTQQTCPMTSPIVTNTYDVAVGGLTITNPIGRLVQAATSNTRTINSYDSVGRVQNQWQCTPQNCGSGYFPFSYGYDLLGNTTSSTNGVGVTFGYAYNTAARLTTLTSSLSDANHPATLLSNVTYNPLGATATATLGNGLNETLAYSNRRWLKSSSAWFPSGGTATPGAGTVTITGSEKSNQLPAKAGSGTVTIQGYEQSTIYYPCGVSSCPTTIYDSGGISITVNGFVASTSYGQGSTSSSLASSLVSYFNSHGTSPVTASLNGSVVTLTAKTTGASTNYTLSTTSTTYSSSYFSSPSFWGSPSGSALTGGANAQTVYDTGTVTIIVSGTTASSYTYGQTDTTASIASGLVSHLSSSFVNASANGAVVTLTAKTTGSATNYPLSVSVSYDTADFSSASFAATSSGTTLTGGTDNTLYSFNISSFAPNGDVLSANDSVNGNWTYTYDPFKRLLGANQNSGQSVYSYDYDRYGNRWHQNGPHTMMLTLSGNNNRMDGYSYDAAGNLLNDGTTAYTFDAENRIISAVNSTSGTSAYVYDANGQRVRKTTAAAGSVDFLYDLAGREVAEVSSTGAWNRGEVYAGGHHLATYWASTTYFIHADWLGTERARTTVSGAVYETCTSLPFGDWLTCAGGDPTPMHFTAKERDFESGLDNFGERYFGSSLGRFMRPDPSSVTGDVVDSENPQAWNMYSYVLNNPLNAVDADGLDYYLIGGDRCGQDGIQCDKQGYVLDNNGNRAVVTDQQINGSNGLAKIDANGNLQINTAQGTFQGEFFDPNIGANGAAIIPQAIVTPSFEEQKFMALQDAGAMATPGVNAALAITAPQLIFMGGATIALSGSGSTLTLEAGAEASEGQIASISRTAAQAGRKGVQRALRSYQKRLAEHLAKLNEIKGDPGSVQREINNFRGLIRAAEEYLSKNP
jgi:RHS repeat-associated protein